MAEAGNILQVVAGIQDSAVEVAVDMADKHGLVAGRHMGEAGVEPRKLVGLSLVGQAALVPNKPYYPKDRCL